MDLKDMVCTWWLAGFGRLVDGRQLIYLLPTDEPLFYR